MDNYLQNIPHMLDERKIKNKDNSDMYCIIKKVRSDYLYNIHIIRTELINQGLNSDEIDDILN
jgi:hypothetical protein